MFGFPLSPDVIAALVAALFGLVVGSFANVVIYRLPLDQSIVFPASRCPRCQTAIRPWQNIPVISWCLLRGRCASCHEPISGRYPAVEAIHGGGFALIVLRFGVWPFTPILLLFFAALVVLAFIDWDHQILPDAITLPGIAIGVFATFIPGALIDWKESSLAALLGYVGFFLVAFGYKRIRGIEGLGQGDWKLAAMMGAFLGGQRLLLVVFAGSVAGMVYGLIQVMRHGGRAESQPEEPEEAVAAPRPDAIVASPDDHEAIGKYKLPFGTFLAGAAIFVLFCGDFVLAWYATFFRF